MGVNFGRELMDLFAEEVEARLGNSNPVLWVIRCTNATPTREEVNNAATLMSIRPCFHQLSHNVDVHGRVVKKMSKALSVQYSHAHRKRRRKQRKREKTVMKSLCRCRLGDPSTRDTSLGSLTCASDGSRLYQESSHPSNSTEIQGFANELVVYRATRVKVGASELLVGQVYGCGADAKVSKDEDVEEVRDAGKSSRSCAGRQFHASYHYKYHE